jgi:hypothetical protein
VLVINVRRIRMNALISFKKKAGSNKKKYNFTGYECVWAAEFDTYIISLSLFGYKITSLRCSLKVVRHKEIFQFCDAKREKQRERLSMKGENKRSRNDARRCSFWEMRRRFCFRVSGDARSPLNARRVCA